MEFAKRTELRSSPKANQNDEKCSYKNDEAENLPRMDSALGVLLDGFAVKEKAEASNNLLNAESPSVPLVRGRSVRQSLSDPHSHCDKTENLTGSRIKSAEENFITKNTKNT